MSIDNSPLIGDRGAQKFDVVIPAGGLIDGEFAEDAGTTVRALAPVGNSRRPVLRVVVDALRQCDRVDKIVCVGPDAIQDKVKGVDRWLPEPIPSGIPQGPANILKGLQRVNPDRLALVCTSDLPFLTAEAVSDFINRLDLDADVVGGIVSAKAYEARFVNAPASEYVGLADVGPTTIGCLFAVRPSIIMGKMDLVANAFNARKSLWCMVRLLGPRLLWEFATKRMSLTSITARLERLLGCSVKVLRDVHPEAAFDIDTIEDYRYSCKP